MISSTRLTGLAAVLAIWLSSPASAQPSSPGAIVVGAGPAPSIRAQPSGKFAVPLIVDMTGAGGSNLAALTTTVSWDRALARLDSVKGGGQAFGTLVTNAAKAAEGSVVLSVFNSTGTTKTVTVATLYFTAASQTGRTKLAVATTVAGNEVGQNIMARVRSRSAAVCVGLATDRCEGSQ